MRWRPTLLRERKMYKAGDIYLTKFHPSYGDELKKFRPCVVLFDQIDSRFVTIVPLTSQAKIHYPTAEFILKPTSTNNLEKSSLLLCWYLQSFDKKRLQKKLGELDKSDLLKLRSSLKQLLI